MIKIADFSPLQGQVINELQEIHLRDITKGNVDILYFKDPVVDKEFIEGLKKLLNRKRTFLIYIECPDNYIIKEQLANHPKKNLISFIYDFMEMEKSGKLTIYDFIRVDLENNMDYWEKLVKFASKVPCIYLLSNYPDIKSVKHIPSNFRFEYETNKQEV